MEIVNAFHRRVRPTTERESNLENSEHASSPHSAFASTRETRQRSNYFTLPGEDPHNVSKYQQECTWKGTRQIPKHDPAGQKRDRRGWAKEGHTCVPWRDRSDSGHTSHQSSRSKDENLVFVNSWQRKSNPVTADKERRLRRHPWNFSFCHSLQSLKQLLGWKCLEQAHSPQGNLPGRKAQFIPSRPPLLKTNNYKQR